MKRTLSVGLGAVFAVGLTVAVASAFGGREVEEDATLQTGNVTASVTAVVVQDTSVASRK